MLTTNNKNEKGNKQKKGEKGGKKGKNISQDLLWLLKISCISYMEANNLYSDKETNSHTKLGIKIKSLNNTVVQIQCFSVIQTKITPF